MGTNIKSKIGLMVFVGLIIIMISPAFAFAANPEIHIVDFAVSETHNYGLAVDSNGNVWGLGNSMTYNFGSHGYQVEDTAPKKIPNFTNVQKVFIVGATSYAIKNDGSVWVWGSNDSGQLGNGTINGENPIIPIPIDGLTDVKEIVGIYGSVFAIKNDGTVWSWGSNNYGELGVGDTTRRLVPTQIPGLNDVKKIMAQHVYNNLVAALKNDGTIYIWGSDGWGGTNSVPAQLLKADSSPLTGISDISISESGYYNAVDNNGDFWEFRTSNGISASQGSSFVTSMPLTGLKKVLHYNWNSYQIYQLQDGSYWGAGSDVTNIYWEMKSSGILGDETPDINGVRRIPELEDNDIVKAFVSVRDNHMALILKNDGTLWGWGFNQESIFKPQDDSNMYVSAVPVKIIFDNENPNLRKTSPLNNGKFHFAKDTDKIEVYFNEPIYQSDNWTSIQIKDQEGNIVPIVSKDVLGREVDLEFTPGENITYTITLPQNSVKDFNDYKNDQITFSITSLTHPVTVPTTFSYTSSNWDARFYDKKVMYDSNESGASEFYIRDLDTGTTSKITNDDDTNFQKDIVDFKKDLFIWGVYDWGLNAANNNYYIYRLSSGSIIKTFPKDTPIHDGYSIRPQLIVDDKNVLLQAERINSDTGLPENTVFLYNLDTDTYTEKSNFVNIYIDRNVDFINNKVVGRDGDNFFLYDLDNGTKTKLTNYQPTNDIDSDDYVFTGDKVYFLAEVDTDWGWYDEEVYELDVNTKAVRKLTNDGIDRSDIVLFNNKLYWNDAYKNVISYDLSTGQYQTFHGETNWPNNMGAGEGYLFYTVDDNGDKIGKYFTLETLGDITPPTVTPNHNSGTYNTSISLTFTANETANIYYTIDGTEPTANNDYKYSVPISISSSKTVKVFAVDQSGNQSSTQILNYIISIPSYSYSQPSYTPAPVMAPKVEEKPVVESKPVEQKVEEVVKTVLVPQIKEIPIVVKKPLNFADIRKSTLKPNNEIYELARRKIIQGDGKNFYPKRETTQAEFITILMRTVKPAVKIESNSKITAKSAPVWAKKSIQTAQTLNLVNINDKPSSYNEKITLKQAAEMLGRVAVLSVEGEGKLKQYTSEDLVNKAAELGLTKGYSKAYINKGNSATRRDVAVLMYRLLTKIGEKK